MGCHKVYHTMGSVVSAIAAIKIAFVATAMVRRQPMDRAAESVELDAPDIAKLCMAKERDL